MRILNWFAGMILGTGLCFNAQAESHGGESPLASLDEATLVAIKEALVSEAQATESKVINTAWLDAKGQLHESTIVHSSMRVRGIQVQAYLDEMQKPKVEIALDDKGGLLPECFAKDDHLKRTVRVNPVRVQDHFVIELRPIAVKAADRLKRELVGFFEESEYWHAKYVVQPASAYQSMVSGLRPEPVRYELDVTVSEGLRPQGQEPEPIPGSDPVSAFFLGKPSAFAENWVHLKVELVKVATGELIWVGTSSLRVPVRPVTYTNQALPDAMAAQIRRDLSAWRPVLDEYVICQPMNFQLTESDGTVQIDGGMTSGLKTGDRLLVIDQTRIPGRVLEPGALAELSLAHIVKVEDDSAIIEHAAGAPLLDATDKVALPF